MRCPYVVCFIILLRELSYVQTVFRVKDICIYIVQYSVAKIFLLYLEYSMGFMGYL